MRCLPVRGIAIDFWLENTQSSPYSHAGFGGWKRRRGLGFIRSMSFQRLRGLGLQTRAVGRWCHLLFARTSKAKKSAKVTYNIFVNKGPKILKKYHVLNQSPIREKKTLQRQYSSYRIEVTCFILSLKLTNQIAEFN